MGDMPSPSQLSDAFVNILKCENNTEIQQATEYINPFASNVEALPVLFEVLHSPAPEARQLAGILIKNHLPSHWSKIPDGFKNMMREKIFVLLTEERERLVRYTFSDLLSCLSRLTFNSDGESWDSVIPHLLEITTSNIEDHVEASLNLLSDIYSELYSFRQPIFTSMLPHFSTLFEKFIGVGEQNTPRIRVAAIKLLGNVIPHLSQYPTVVEQYRQFFANVLATIQYLVKTGEDALAIECLSVFDDLLEVKIPYLQPMIPVLVNFCKELGSTTELDINLRSSALYVIHWLCQYKPKQVVKHNLLQHLIEWSFELITHYDEEEEQIELEERDAYTSGELTTNKLGCQLLDKLSSSVAGVKTFQISLPLISTLANSQKTFERRAALSALMVLCKGSRAIMSQHLATFIPFLLQGMNDEHPLTRRVAVITVGQFAEYLLLDDEEEDDEEEDGQDIVKNNNNIDDLTATQTFKTQLLPALIHVVDTNDGIIQEAACYSITTLVEHISQDLLQQYSNVLMDKFMGLDIQVMVVAVISAIAGSSRETFKPYNVMTLMQQLLQSSDPNHAELKARALECAGLVGLAIGKQLFAPYAEYFITVAVRAIMEEEEENDLKEFTFAFLGNISECLGPDFQKYLSSAMPIILAGCQSTSGVELKNEGGERNLPGIGVASGEVQALRDFTVTNSFVDQKVNALSALALILYNCGAESCRTYMGKIVEVVAFLMRYIHPLIREKALKPVEAILTIMNDYKPPQHGKKWKAGVPARKQPLSRDVVSLLDIFMPLLLGNIVGDHEKSVVEANLSTVGHILELLGPSSIESRLNLVVEAISKVLLKVTTAHKEAEDWQSDDNIGKIDDVRGDDDEEDFDLFIKVGDVIVTLSKALGHRFISVWGLIDTLCQYLNGDVEDRYRQNAMGIIAEVVEALADKVQPKAEFLVKLSLQGMHDSYPPTQANATYCMGLLSQVCNEVTLPVYGEVLNLIPPLLELEAYPEVADNACGLLARFILSSPNNVPLDQVLPLLFQHLPLLEDMEENKAVYPMLFALYDNQHPQVEMFIPTLLQLFSAEISDPSIQNSIRKEMMRVVKKMILSHNGILVSVASALNEEQRQNINRALKS